MRFKETSFELVLSTDSKVILLLVSGFLLLSFTSIQISEGLGYTIGLSEKNQRLLIIILVATGLYGLYRLLKRMCAEPMQVKVCADRLLVLNRKTGIEKEVEFVSIESYQFIDFNNEATLRLKLVDGRKMKLQVNGLLHRGQNLAGLVQAFEAALRQQVAIVSGAKNPVVAMRERTFFEKPVSTVLLLLFASLLSWMAWEQHVHHRHVSGGMFSLWGIFSTYLAAWLVGWKRRNPNEAA